MDQNLAILLAVFAVGLYFSAFFWCVPISSGSVAIMFVSVQTAGIAANKLARAPENSTRYLSWRHLGARGVAICRFACAMPCMRAHSYSTT
jgi:multisubunit Na+/H+ antiporter MnhG subunit